MEGDAAIYPQLFDTYYNSLVYFSLRITQDQQQSEDIAVEALVKLWQVPTRFESTGKLRAYLFTLVRNASFNYLKHQKVRERSQQAIADAALLTEAHAAALGMETDVLRLVYEEIERLPDTYREVVSLLYIRGMAPADAAAALDISMENLRQRKGRAIKMLKNELIRKGLSDFLFSLIFF